MTGDNLKNCREILKAIFDDSDILALARSSSEFDYYTLEYYDAQSRKVIARIKYYGPLVVGNTDRYRVDFEGVGAIAISPAVGDRLQLLGERLNIGEYVE